ncbi:16S rRNA (guanine(966)-N(2))-methyltransferase RsmD [Aeromonas diversa]|uniref:16S rRNA (guanine(966)-N(2))-methyltransferase RsmD n=1 Tax=Aeromonas diversa TaxID=502790 RepID=UPI0039A1DA24
MPRAKNSRNSPSPQGKSGFVRIISGQWRGRKLPVRDVEGLRPTTDRVKETIFNWLAPHVRETRCLDLFAGSGGLGFEALSRYARQVTLIERDRGAADQLRRNVALLGSSAAEVIETDAVSWLQGPARPFDLVFLDPPFRKDLLPTVCTLLEQNGWLADGALIYLEREKEAEPPSLPVTWHLIKDKQAGQVCYQLYQRETHEDVA